MALETTTSSTSLQKKSSEPRWYLLLTKRSMTSRDRRFFCERLGLLLETGTALHQSLQTLEEQAENPALRAIIRMLRDDIDKGLDFSKALAHYPHVFSPTYVNLIAAGEQGGFLASALKQLTELEQKQAWLRSTVSGALFYPGFLIAFSVAVVMFVLTVVFPKFQTLFVRMADQLPLTTKLLMGVSEFLNGHWLTLLIGMSIGILALRQWMNHPAGEAMVDRMKLGVPLLRTIFIQVYLSQFMRVMGVSLDHGVTVLNALQACRDVVRNRVFRGFVADLETCVAEGKGFSKGFQQSVFVPPLVKQMIATGEDAGKLPLVMNRLADFYDAELTRGLYRLSKLIEPLMLLVMGVLVGLIVSALVLPIFKMARVVG